MSVFHRLYQAVVDKAAHPKAERYLYGLSFCESSFFPIPPDVMLAPMCAVTPERAFRLAIWTTVFSVAGGYFGYIIGFFFFDAIRPLLLQTDYWAYYQQSVGMFEEHGAWIIFVSAFSPIPYKIFTISAGVLEQDLLVFGIASLLGRGGRFLLVAAILRWVGPKVLPYVERWVHIIGWAVVLIVAALIIISFGIEQ